MSFTEAREQERGSGTAGKGQDFHCGHVEFDMTLRNPKDGTEYPIGQKGLRGLRTGLACKCMFESHL